MYMNTDALCRHRFVYDIRSLYRHVPAHVREDAVGLYVHGSFARSFAADAASAEAQGLEDRLKAASAKAEAEGHRGVYMSTDTLTFKTYMQMVHKSIGTSKQLFFVYLYIYHIYIHM